MHKGKRATSSLFVFLLVALFFLLLAPLLFPALGPPISQEYDYVDNNTSDEDASPDKGTHLNFTAQQYDPDSIYDTLTEENTGEALLLDDFVDNNISDVDNSPDIGTHSNFENEKLKDGVYDTLTESGAAGEIIRDGVAQGQDISATVTFSHTLGYSSGNNRLVIVAAGFENSAGDINIGSATYNGQSMTKIVQATSGGTGYVASVALFYLLDSNLPSSSGSYSVVVTADSNPNADLWACAVSYIGVKQEAPDDYDSDSSSLSTTMTSELNCDEDGSMLVQTSVVGNIGSFSPSSGTTEVIEDSDINSASAVFNEKLGQDSGARDLGCTQGSMNRGAWVGACWAPAGADADYDLDIEVQFTSVIDFLETEKLCIYMGTMGAEDLNVSYWAGSSWIELDSDLTPSSWNNYTVSLSSSTFTIRFETETAIGDESADGYQVDAVLLCVEGVGSKEDPVDADDSNVDNSVDVGTLSNFDNMKTKDGMATLTEGLSIVWSNDTQPANLILETNPDISGLAATYEVYGLTNLASDDGTYGGGDIQDNGATNDPQEVSLIMEFDYSSLGMSGSDITHLRFETEVYFIGGTGRAPVTDPWEMETTFYNGSVEIYNWNSGSWEIMGTVFIDDPADLSLWDSAVDTNPERPLVRSKGSGFSDSHMSPTGIIRIRIQMTGVFQGTAYDGCSVIDYVDVDLQYGGGDDYLLDQEVQWTDLPHELPNEELCVYGGTMGSEDIKVEVWSGTGWETVFSDLSSGWNNKSVTDWLTGPIFTIRFKGGTELGDTTQDQWQIDIALILVWSMENYELDLEVQWTNATYTQPYEELCIYGGTMGSENLRVDVWTGSAWQNLFTDLSSGWNNISVTDYLTSSMFTIRFKGGTETGDTIQDSWEIDSTLLHTWGIAPIANFSYAPEYPYTGETVTFNASDSYDPDGTIISYFWNFGDGTNGTDMVTTYSYADDGTYTVVLTVTDNDGLSDTASRDVIVLNRPPVATFTESAETVYTGESIAFNASSSYDPDGVIVGYFWDFGDGTNATGVTVEHAYSDDGNYTVTLTVTDDDGATASTNATKTVLNRPPTASFTESAETVYTGEAISFNATASYDPDGVIVSYFWDFGDGANATSVIVEHAYVDDGVYTVTLTVTDDDGATASVSATKTILNRPPVAIFTESTETVYTGETIAFNASASYDSDGSVVSYFWDFGDGTNAIGVLVEHDYADDGVYSVTLTVTDNDGATGIVTSTKTILNRPPVAIFTESTETAYTGEPIIFNASDSYDPDGSIVSYFWDFGDGANATGVIVGHAYATNGTYTVTLTVADDDGASNSASATKTILRNEPPVALFTESAETVYTGEAITFNASNSYDPDGTIISYEWDFGDGTNATGVVVEHTYVDDGIYTVTLTVTDDKGAIGTTTSTKTVLNRPPVASFTETAETVYTGEAISLNASASYDPDGTIATYFWDFGDGTNATGVVIEHAYADDGTYNVTLTVTDNDSAAASTSATKTVFNRPPVAIFTESATTVLTGEVIFFNASDSYDSDGSIVSYFWDFGDGANATGVVVEHAYAEDGSYTVTLTVTDDDGATDVATSTKTVLNRPPVASFTESAETVYVGEAITFNASASYDLDGSIVSYVWDFGDGVNASGVLVEHAYANDGAYTVTLTVTDDDGATGIVTATKTVLNRPPIASFTESAETVYTGESIAFNASSSYDPDGVIVGYFWDFGDGTNATGVTVEHAYSDDGNYTVTLTVTDDDGATAATSAIKMVLNRSPFALFTESAETVLTEEVIYFDASASYDPDGTIVSYFWDFGDGTNATGVIVEHSYADDGVYTVALTVTDDDGTTDIATSTKTILNRPPVALFTESGETVYTGETVAFNASDSYDLDGSIVSYFWDFGDGTNATGVIVEHTYAEDGNYTVTLTVTDDDNATMSTSATKTVLNRPPVASFTESAETVYTGQTIAFNASASYDSDGVIVSYFWDFGDGTNSTGVMVEHAYAEDGSYTVTLTVTDDDNATDTATSTKTVLNRPPVASFTESAETVYVGEAITFNASASYDPDGTINYFWDFGDGTNATGVIVEHSYMDDGIYNVTLTVTDDDGATDTAMSTKTVLNRPPVASFSESAGTVLTGEVIYFDASASYDPDGSIVNYFWDFGDGTNGSGVIVDHSYTDDGAYTVTLTVTDDDGATASTSATKTVLNRPPVATFTESAEAVYTDEVIAFNASASYDPDGYVASYFWDFGDGTNATGLIVDHSYADNGTYTATLMVTDDDGVTDTTTATKTVLNRSPVAIFTESAEVVYTDEVIYFNASDSYDPDGSIVGYFWDFGDGINATGFTTDHAYANDGNYIVTLAIIDNDGAVTSASSTKTILNRPPVASFTESAETVYTGVVISFDAINSYDPDGTIVSYFWDFGDGTTATGVAVGHSYADGGNYTVILTVTDNDGGTGTATAIKAVLNRSPTATFTESATVVNTGTIIYFDASDSYDPDGIIVSYFWDFGDGTNATGVTIGHSYEDDGSYVVTLRVTDDDGATGVATATKNILNRLPVASFTESAETAYTSETISFNASESYDPDGSVVSYFWDFGDGTNATEIIVGHAYPEDGNYIVTLTVADDDGATASSSATKTVLNRSPVSSFTESAETVLVDETIYFNASASYDLDGQIVSYFWDFGDGANATGVTAEHAYTDSGVYTVTLTVTDDDGATASATATKNVEVTPPVAIFTESTANVYTSETIYFNASDSYDPDGTVVSYFWDFGDGANATGVTAEHAYADDGNYTVTLTVTDDDGATDSTTATKRVLSRAPVASFTESAETAFTGELITFNASASYDSDGSIVSYFWDFGDGANATGMIVTHGYAEDGSYIVTLTVTDDDGATGTVTASKTIANRPPVALFAESAETVYTNEIIVFNASASYDPDGTIISRFWDFGDGTNATGIIVEHSYPEDGVYTVTLTVTDDDGATSSTNATKTILNRTPVATFTESAETGYTGEIITFNASASYDSDGSIVSYFWDFGDGTNATGVIVSHSYADDGNYTVILTVNDDDGTTDTAASTKTALNRPPVAIFTESAESVLTGEVIYFNASDSHDPDGYIASYFWDFGDGTNATGVTVEHAYAEEGTYTVALILTDDDGATASTTATKIVGNSAPVAILTESAETVYTGVVISFDAGDSYDPDGIIVKYFWDFGDGTNATGVSVGHAYSDDGVYTVTLTVTDDDGATDTATSTKTVLNRPPVASFTESATTVSTGTVIHFDASGSYDPDGVIVTYFWDFGDGTNATGVTVDHAYADDGAYIVTLTVTDDGGATSTATGTKTVLNRPPVASFTESTETVYTSEAITFNASDSYDPDGYIVSYEWDFGDGTTATGMIVTHAYAEDGSYTVTLTVTDDDGATASTSSIKSILNQAPIALFTESAESVVSGEIIYFNASGSYDPDGSIVGYFWDFGDGTNATGVTIEHAYADNGTYVVTLTVTDDDDAIASASATKVVGNKPPVAIFTESAEVVYTGETIHFNASESYDPDGSVVSYFWDFGDGTNTTGITVGHAYSDAGNYTVTLTVTDDDGIIDTATSTKTVLNRPPVAFFEESAETVYIGESITFNASDSYDPDGGIITYFWDFGDGTNGTGIIVQHVYVTNGTYTVLLTVLDNDGGSNSASSTKTVLWNESPVALFTESAETVYTGETVTFNASISYDPDGNIVTYFWDFGDGTNGTGVVVEHAYVDDGNYTVTLMVTDNVGATGSSIATKTVLNRSPIPLFTESAETVYTGEVIYFNASDSYDPDGTIASYFWDFGDGINGTGVIMDHAYADNGTYIVTLTITDDDGASNSTTANKTVLNSPPVALFSESAESVYTGQIITFNASDSYDPDGYVTSYFWDFGDGTNDVGMVVEHIYYVSGTFTVTLNITDDDGDFGATAATKTVLWNGPPVALFTESAYTIYQGENIAFDASDSYDPDGNITSYFWDFGDGTNATGMVVEHIYVDDGTYFARLTVTDDKGAKDTAIATKTVLNRIPVALFTVSPMTVYTGEVVTFNASDSYDPDGYVISYFWDFGDGTNATGIIVTHAYDDDGEYTITLTVTDDDGGTGSSSATKIILNWPPVAIFTMSPMTVYTGEVVTFNASDSYDPDGYVISYLWDFGDGNTASGVIAHHAYSDNKLHVVTLTVADNDLGQDTEEGRIMVLNRSPAASFVESAETTYVGTPIEFDASDSYDPDGYIVSYFWDFGDGTNATGMLVEHAYYVDGTFTVTLTATDDDGGSNSAQASKTILENALPIASFTESAETVYTSEIIAFNASSSYDPDGYVVEFFWDFGDGTNALGVAVEHAYSQDGNYTVTLMVTDDHDATASIIATKTVLNRPPIALFIESAQTVYMGEFITFNSTTSYDPDGYVASYFWDFGDGTNTTGIIASHAYSSNGTFVVTLTVRDDDGASSSTQAAKNILLGGMHDVAVVNVTPSAPDVYTRVLPYSGQVLNVTVIAFNEGIETETFNVTVYYAVVQGWHLVEVDAHLVWYSDNKAFADFLLLTSINVPTSNPVLTFDTKYNIEALWDFGFVQVSRDGGVTWTSLENSNTTYNHDSETFPNIIANLPGLTGTNLEWPNWTSMSFDLTDYAGETVLLGFRYMTDTRTQGEGWYIDNVRVNDYSISNQAFEQSNPPTIHVIQTQTINNLTPDSQVILTFSWNTTGITPGKYTVSAIATPLPGETDITDNTYFSSPVEVKIWPDLDGDWDVDLFDAVKLLACYGTKEGDADYDPTCDLNYDGRIDLYDSVILLSHYGEMLE